MSNLRDLMRHKLFRGILLLLAVGAGALGAAISILDHRKPFPVKAGPGVTELRHLHAYWPPRGMGEKPSPSGEDFSRLAVWKITGSQAIRYTT